jgi:cobalt transporter subunit CbtA
MFREILLAAGVAGLLAALMLTLTQTLWITPLILQAETYEDAAESATAVTTQQHRESHEHEHHHDASEWKPSDGLQRALFTLVSNIVMGVGYALLLIGVYTLWRRPNNIAEALLFGLAGFAVFFGAPGLGLPPELPGTEAAELAARQQWWIGTAIATAIGLALLCAQNNWILRALGGAVLLAPHLIGAPHLATESSLAPVELQTQFRLATVISNAVFWLLLGAVSAFALRKFSPS